MKNQKGLPLIIFEQVAGLS